MHTTLVYEERLRAASCGIGQRNELIDYLVTVSKVIRTFVHDDRWKLVVGEWIEPMVCGQPGIGQ